MTLLNIKLRVLPFYLRESTHVATSHGRPLSPNPRMFIDSTTCVGGHGKLAIQFKILDFSLIRWCWWRNMFWTICQSPLVCHTKLKVKIWLDTQVCEGQFPIYMAPRNIINMIIDVVALKQSPNGYIFVEPIEIPYVWYFWNLLFLSLDCDLLMWVFFLKSIQEINPQVFFENQ